MMKYIRTKQDDIIVFPATMNHRQFTHFMGLKADDIVSAGFVEFTLSCYGKSVSLGVHSLPEDSALLRNQLGVGYGEKLTITLE